MSSDETYRTAITRIAPAEDERNLLEQTTTEWKRGCNIAVDAAWGTGNLDAQAVQSLAYDRVREQTALKSQHAILATHQAADSMRSCIEQHGIRSASKPSFTTPTIRYDSRSMTLFDDGTVSLMTVESRVRCPLVLPEDGDSGYQQQFLDDDAWSLTESTLTIRDGRFYLHLGFKRPVTESDSIAADGAVLGVDIGVDNLAVTSTAQFFSGSELNHRRDEFERIRGRLQQTKTRSARRTLRSMSGREQRHVRGRLHDIANEIVGEAQRYDCTIIAFEDLDGIRDRIPEAGFFHRWAFRQLVAYVTYRTELLDIRVETVDPTYTSLRCADCGHVDDANRPSRGQFRCQRCETSANADYNAAKNVALKYVRRGPQSSRRTGASRCALKSGTVTPNGEFTPYPKGFEAEFTDKSTV